MSLIQYTEEACCYYSPGKPEFAGHPPPILKPEECVYPLLESYTSLEDYQTIMTRLLLMETWDMVSFNLHWLVLIRDLGHNVLFV